jgi:hypothetical protein
MHGRISWWLWIEINQKHVQKWINRTKNAHPDTHFPLWILNLKRLNPLYIARWVTHAVPISVQIEFKSMLDYHVERLGNWCFWAIFLPNYPPFWQQSLEKSNSHFRISIDFTIENDHLTCVIAGAMQNCNWQLLQCHFNPKHASEWRQMAKNVLSDTHFDFCSLDSNRFDLFHIATLLIHIVSIMMQTEFKSMLYHHVGILQNRPDLVIILNKIDPFSTQIFWKTEKPFSARGWFRNWKWPFDTHHSGCNAQLKLQMVLMPF